MHTVIYPGDLKGCLKAPPSKSEFHRALICAALSQGTTEIFSDMRSEDCLATMECLRALGAGIRDLRGSVTVTGIFSPSNTSSSCPTLTPKGTLPDNAVTLNCNESGSTLRFLLPVAAALGKTAEFIGKERLFKRPIQPLLDQLSHHGATVENPEERHLMVKGQLKPGTYELTGNISSQFISGLLFALPLLKAHFKIVCTKPVESYPYLQMTLFMLRKFSQIVSVSDGKDTKGQEALIFEGGSNLGDEKSPYRTPGSLAIAGDWSQAAFWLVAASISRDSASSGIELSGLDLKSLQGDRSIIDYLRQMGADIREKNGGLLARPSELHAQAFDLAHTPDLLPPLAIAAACARRTSCFTGIERLRFKETDRINTVLLSLQALGVDASAEKDRLYVTGRELLNGGTVYAHNDHRIAMMLAIAATRCVTSLTIEGSECINKSYPHFFRDVVSLGGHVEGWI